MGSGKTTIFKRVMENTPKLIGFDLDELVKEEISEGLEDLGQAIERVGFEKFRKVEKDLLLQKLKESGNALISLGGGSLSSEVIAEIENSEGIKLVWVDTDFETCWERISKESHRPLVKKGRAALESLFQERVSIYRQASLTLNSEEQGRVSKFEELDDECKTGA